MELIPIKIKSPSAIEELSPETFTFVMATGIVARDCRVAGMGGVASALLWVAVFAYLALLLLLIGRVIRFPMQVADDLASPRRTNTSLDSRSD